MKNKKRDMYSLINNIVRIILLISIIPYLMKDEYNKILFIGITLLLTCYDWLIKKIFKIELSNPLKYSILFLIFTTEYLGSTIEFYDKFYWWDTFVHGVSGIVDFYIGLEFINKLNKNLGKEELHPAVQILFGLCFSLAVVGLWEIAEYFIDEVCNLNMQITAGLVGQEAIWDSIEDMLSATIGTVIAVIIQCFHIRKSKKINN